jgi:hypothetical protein
MTRMEAEKFQLMKEEIFIHIVLFQEAEIWSASLIFTSILPKEKFQKIAKVSLVYFYSKRWEVYLRDKTKRRNRKIDSSLEIRLWYWCWPRTLAVLWREDGIITESVSHVLNKVKWNWKWVNTKCEWILFNFVN